MVNPSIKNIKVCKLGSPSSIYDLLANTVSTTKFEMDVNRLSADVGLPIMAGISRNSSLRVVNLNAAIGPKDVILSGIGASSLESLTLSHNEPSANLRWAASKMLLSTPSLKVRFSPSTIPAKKSIMAMGMATVDKKVLGVCFRI